MQTGEQGWRHSEEQEQLQQAGGQRGGRVSSGRQAGTLWGQLSAPHLTPMPDLAAESLRHE